MSDLRHVVFLLHGIRTQGEWAQRTASVLEADPQVRARPIRYEFFDVVRFLLPIAGFRERPVRRISRLIRDELGRRPAALSIVAHSFGTFIVAKLLEQEPDIRIHRLILCGSIIPDSFDWERYGHRLGTDSQEDWQVVNDCGMQDLWPVLAKSVTWGYGSSGRFGFGHPRVKDRFFKTGHSGFFSDSTIRTYWIPYLSRGEIVEGVLERPTNPWWVSVLTVFKIRYIVLLLLTVAAITAGGAALRHLPPEITGSLRVKLVAETPIDTESIACNSSLKLTADDEASTLSSYSKSVDPAPRVLCERLLAKRPNDPASIGLYARALVVEGRLEEGIARFQRAAALGDTHSNLVLGYYFLRWRESDRTRGLAYLQAAAQQGSGEALLALGKAFELGTLATPDYEKAAEYYAAASKAGMTDAMYRLGQLYDQGLGVQKDSTKARELYRSAAGLGHRSAVEALNEISKRN